MENCVKQELQRKGYYVNSTAQGMIALCDDWYSNKATDFHKRVTVQGERYELGRVNFVKRCCSDDANLCEVVEVNSGNKEACDFVTELFKANNFNVIYRKQLEKISAVGTSACYVILEDAEILKYPDGRLEAKGGVIKLNYVDAQCFIPLTVENDIITEAAFSGSGIEKGNKVTTLVIFTLDEQGRYLSETHVYDQYGTEMKDRQITVTLDTVKPFAVLRNAESNNLDNMDGYGLPKVMNALPLFEALDLAFNVLFGDLDKGEKLLLVNELLCKFDSNGKPITPNEQAKKTFVMLQKESVGTADMVHEYNPEIRADDVTKAMELILSLISMSFGYGTKKYSFENGQITTATEYVGERQDQMQEINRQRQEAIQYISDIVKASMWFSNTFCGTSYDINYDIQIDFDDSYIIDKEAKLDRERNDALSFDIPQLKIWYLMDAYNLAEEEATALVTQAQEEQEQKAAAEETPAD